MPILSFGGDNVREAWDVYGEDFMPINGRIAYRGRHDLGAHEYHLVVYAWIISDDNRIILSKRQKGKSFSGLWECTGGCAKAGEDSKSAVLREVSEELGITLDPVSGELYRRYKRHYPVGAKAICDVWIFRQNIDISLIVPQKEEVSEVRTVSAEELLSMHKNGAFKKRYLYVEDMLEKFCGVT